MKGEKEDGERRKKQSSGSKFLKVRDVSWGIYTRDIGKEVGGEFTMNGKWMGRGGKEVGGEFTMNGKWIVMDGREMVETEEHGWSC